MSEAWRKAKKYRIHEIWPLLPAAVYLVGFLTIVGIYLLGLTFSFEKNGVTAFPTLRTVSAVFSTPEFRRALLDTTVFTAVGTPLELAVGLFLALILYQQFRFRKFIRSMFLIPLAIPALVTATLLFILFDYPGGHINYLLMGKYGFFPALIHVPVNWRGSEVLALGISMLGKVWRDMPISMLILLSGLSAIDPELFDAARTMGAGLRTRLLRVVVPLMIPSISAVVLLRSIEMWKEFIFPFVLAGKYALLGTLIESMYNDWGNSGGAAAVALVLVLCIVVTTFLFLSIMEILRKTLVRT
ncbi:MAG TPA: sugar ABC transporter permease [Chitinivibrionales bacterium]|jgi:ABC-type sugar transport system permease subunit|nr:sugar ABC transporter permease [Chitinivibrionales bacterium]